MAKLMKFFLTSNDVKKKEKKTRGQNRSPSKNH